MRIIEKKLNSVEYAQVERILEKIAAENNIENVNGISVEINDRTATIKYAAGSSGEWGSTPKEQANNFREDDDYYGDNGKGLAAENASKEYNYYGGNPSNTIPSSQPTPPVAGPQPASTTPQNNGIMDTIGNYANKYIDQGKNYINQKIPGVADAAGSAVQGVKNYINPSNSGQTPATNANPGITAPETYGNDFNNPETPWGNSISEFLAAHGKPSDFNSRRQMAVDFGIVNSPNEYTGTAQQNTQLLGLMSSGQGGSPAPPAPGQNPEQPTPPVEAPVAPPVEGPGGIPTNPGATPMGETPTPNAPAAGKYGPGAISPSTGKPIDADGTVTTMDGVKHKVNPDTGDLE